MTEEDFEQPEFLEPPAPSGARRVCYYVGRYGAMASTSTFTSNLDDLRPGETVIGSTDRGTEIVEVVMRVNDLRKLPTNTPFPRLLRRMTSEDSINEERIQRETCPAEFKFCHESIQARKLPMKLTFVEHLLGGERVIFYFLADARVDFRELVRELAREFQARIELKQIGVRDEARILSDYEHCGRPLCCRTFIKKLQPVSMKMAKNQKATLDPSKISGACGRLMCCLRYEDRVYTELQKNIPKRGSVIETADGMGRLIDADVLCQTLLVEMGARNRIELKLDDVVAVHPRGTPIQPAQPSAPPPTPPRRKIERRPPPQRPGPADRDRSAEPPATRTSPDAPPEKTPANAEGPAAQAPRKRKRRRRRRKSKPSAGGDNARTPAKDNGAAQPSGPRPNTTDRKTDDHPSRESSS